MRSLRSALVIAFALVIHASGLVAPAAAAIGTVDLSWNACSPVVATLERGAPVPVTMFASVVGHDEPHQAYQIFLYLTSGPAGPLRDAWRFDAAGCQGESRIELRHIPPATVAKACPAFQGAAQSLQVKQYTYDPGTGNAKIVVANSYPAGITTSNPATRYFLMSATFDHTESVVGTGTPGVSCGGFEGDVWVVYNLPCSFRPCTPDGNRPRWLGTDGVEREFFVGQDTLLYCGSCIPVPAAKATWGAVKGTYRR